METTKIISENKNYTAVNIGSLNELMQHTLVHPVSGQIIEGKAFLKEPTRATGTEISFNSLPPHTDLSYFHVHEQNEETYIILRGSGYFQVDEDCFPISEGSVIRVAPKGIRGMSNASDGEMVYIVIQSQENSLKQYSTADGMRVEHQKKW
ncbi:cupin domain-containing protein [uncultured Bacteroides sp.]|uniref:cupin domain-containing protein n=1 Tax=uncultured Bacteroides sp. TaxID=162156 RepID=UPI0025D24A8E|nr:cupin domain-containing protein [uncultured Bacteroides sp.]